MRILSTHCLIVRTIAILFVAVTCGSGLVGQETDYLDDLYKRALSEIKTNKELVPLDARQAVQSLSVLANPVALGVETTSNQTSILDNLETYQLRRGTEVYEISLGAAYRSGLLAQAVVQSPELYAQVTETLMVQSMVNQKRIDKDDNWKSEELDAVERIFLRKLNQAVLSIGLNGGSVAEVISDSTGNNRRYVLLKPLGRPGQELGYAITEILDNAQLGRTTIPSEFLPSTPPDPNAIFYSNRAGTQRLSDAVTLETSDKKEEKKPAVQFNALARFGLFYDTAAPPADGNFAQGVFLDGGFNPAAGQTNYLQEGGSSTTDLDLLLNTTILAAGNTTLSAFYDGQADVTNEDVQTRYLAAQAIHRDRTSPFNGWTVGLGTLPSLFAQQSYIPANLVGAGSLIGTGDRFDSASARPQLSLSIPMANDIRWGVAVEKPFLGDINEIPGNNKASDLTRWPTVATNLEFGDVTKASAFRVAAIFRTLGFQDTVGQEHFDSAWGLSASGKIGSPTRNIMFGISGGDGVGQYIEGINNSAILDVSSLQSVTAYGSFVGIHNERHRQNGTNLDAFNMAYGYSWAETPTVLGGTENTRLQQAWVNYIRFINEYAAFGIQYEYGYRKEASGDAGDNSRLLFMFALKTGTNKRSTGVVQVARQVERDENSKLLTSQLDQKYPIQNNIVDAVRQYQTGDQIYLPRF